MVSTDEFQEILDEAPEVEIRGIKYCQGWLLRRADPIAFDEQYWEYVHACEEEELE